ncbi:hypothetical protein BSLG_008823 [Batrachochytrium salamandrivorans]|nr:hypothetical protein BSLG_008823 [Batrachochytrium salamandrivorans]
MVSHASYFISLTFHPPPQSLTVCVSASEVVTICKAFTDASGIRASGIMISGGKYFALRADDRSIYGKKDKSGVVMVKTKQAILIGIYEDPVQPGEANKVVEGLADYLISVNYVMIILWRDFLDADA